MDARTRALAPEHPSALDAITNVTISPSRNGEHAETAVLLRTTLAARTRAVGPDDEGTLITADHLTNALIRLGECVEAEVIK